MIFRPLLGWATAWSFDCLRLALERGVAPRALCTQAAAAASLRLAAAVVWFYQGLVPKLLFPDSGEREILHGVGVFAGHEAAVLAILGGLEILFGAALLACPRSTGLLRGMVVILVGLLIGAAMGQHAVFVAPFNPMALTVALLGLVTGELWLRRDPLPSAHRCGRVAPHNVRALT